MTEKHFPSEAKRFQRNKFILQQDNASIHVSEVFMNFFEKKNQDNEISSKITRFRSSFAKHCIFIN